MSARGVEYATEHMLDAEAASDYVTAVWWADGRDRIIAADAKKKPSQSKD